MMVSSISSTAATQAAYPVRAAGASKDGTAASQTVAAASTEATSAVTTQSAESAAAARLGEQLGAQADAARVQRAVDDGTATTLDASQADTEPQASTRAAAAPAPSGAGGASSSSATTDTDYIAEADTNSDKTVSDQERLAYEAKLREQAEESAATSKEQAAPAQERSAEVRAAYGVDGEAASTLEITA